MFIHRNILLDDNFTIKLADFGISRYNDNETFTEMQGTLKYMSPEVQCCSPYSVKADIWSTGCVIFELIKLEKFHDFIHSEKFAQNSTEIIKLQSNLKELLKRYC